MAALAAAQAQTITQSKPNVFAARRVGAMRIRGSLQGPCMAA